MERSGSETAVLETLNECIFHSVHTHGYLMTIYGDIKSKCWINEKFSVFCNRFACFLPLGFAIAIL